MLAELGIWRNSIQGEVTMLGVPRAGKKEKRIKNKTYKSGGVFLLLKIENTSRLEQFQFELTGVRYEC